MSATPTLHIDAPSMLVRVRSKHHPSCLMGIAVAWWKTNGVTLGKSLRIWEGMPSDPSFERIGLRERRSWRGEARVEMNRAPLKRSAAEPQPNTDTYHDL